MPGRASSICVSSDAELLANMKERLTYDPILGAFFRRPGFRGVISGARLGSPDSAGSYQAVFLGRRFMCAQLVWLWETGSLPSGTLHRVNGNPGDDRFENLDDGYRKQAACFLERSRARFHGLDYTRVQYAGVDTAVEIGCPIHGWFYRKPERFLESAKGCPGCCIEYGRERSMEHNATLPRMSSEEKREKNRLRCARRYQLEPEKQRARTRSWLGRVQADPDRYASLLQANNKRSKAWLKTDKGRTHSKQSRQRRRARLRDTKSPGVSAEAWEAICKRYTNEDGDVCCAYCKKPCAVTTDHVYPIARGGLDEASNVVPACRSCNSSKCHRLISEWSRAALLLTPQELATYAATTPSAGTL